MTGSSGGQTLGTPRQDGEIPLCKDWILSSIYAWIYGGRTKEEIMPKVMTSFDLLDLRAAATKLRDGKWASPNIKVPGESTAEYSRQLAGEVYDCLVRIQNEADPKVQFYVSAVELKKVQAVGPFSDPLDEPAVAARLGLVDTKLQVILDRLMAAEQLESTVAGLAKTVSDLQEQVRGNQDGQQLAEAVKVQTAQMQRAAAALQQVAEQQRVAEQVKGVRPQPMSGMTWAEQAGGRSRMGVLRAEADRRDRSTSSKRGRDSNSDTEAPLSQRSRQEVRQSVTARTAHPAPLGSALSQDLAQLAEAAGRSGHGREESYTVVRRKKRAGVVQKGSSAVEAEGGVRAPFSVFLSGTSPATTEEIVKEKLLLCASQSGGGENGGAEKLEILKVEHIPLKIPSGETPRSRCWKVTVAPQGAEYMQTSAAYPASWGWRRWNRGSQSLQSRGQQGGDRPLNVGA
jgi:phenylpyruvate tautomerase PptA (4-oxalocrotonate tautomerase family)